jgi:SAM-dependent methyltransferase
LNQALKNILISLRIYYPLQGAYQQFRFQQRLKKYRKEYSPFSGEGFECEVCGSKYSKFVPDVPAAEDRDALEKNKVIAGYGENILCPNCGSTARERLVLNLLKHDIEFAGKKILHLSPEKNIYNFIKGKAQVTTADLLPGFYRTIDGLVQKQDATNFTFADESFDLVIGNHILEHIPDDAKAMKEIYRVLKPGGGAILQVPYSESIPATLEAKEINDPALQSKLYGQKDHVRIYTFNDYVQRLRSAGFAVEIIDAKNIADFAGYAAVQPGEHFLNITKPATS